MPRTGLVAALIVVLLLPTAAQAKRVCVEKLSGVCLKYEERPEPARPVSPALAEERRLGLGRADRKLVQQVLQSDGFYTGSIDGLFGPGTRRALRNWQRERGYARTGYLTGRQFDAFEELAAKPPPVAPTPALAPTPAPTPEPTPAPDESADAYGYIANRSFDCEWKTGKRTLMLFDSSNWSSPQGGRNFYGSWKYAAGKLTLDLYQGRFGENGETSITYDVTIDGSTMKMGEHTCTRRPRG